MSRGHDSIIEKAFIFIRNNILHKSYLEKCGCKRNPWEVRTCHQCDIHNTEAFYLRIPVGLYRMCH